MNMLIDSDCGFDDMLAVCMVLASHKAVRLRGITSVHGMSSPGLGATTMRRLLTKLGFDGCGVVAGAPEPRAGGALLEQVDWGREYIVKYPARVESLGLPPLNPLPDGTAEAAGRAILTNANKCPGAVLLCLGPLTNVAAAIEMQSKPGELASLLSRVVVMGGAVRVPGNMGPGNQAELNLFSDPSSAATVINSGLAVDLLDLDCTGEKALGGGNKLDVLEALGALKAASVPGEYLQKLLRNDLALVRSGEGAVSCLYDPVAACYALDRTAFDFELVNIEVCPESGVTKEAPLGDTSSVTLTLPIRFTKPLQYQHTLARLITST